MVEYLGRYTHRVAISNHRLIHLENGRVCFHWRDYRHGAVEKTLGLEAPEFLRRFLLHVLPSGFVRSRHYGLLANCQVKVQIAPGRHLLAVAEAVLLLPTPAASWQQLWQQWTGKPFNLCPVCQKGYLHRTLGLLPKPPLRSPPATV